MKKPEKYIERFPQTIIRTVITTTVITFILIFARVIPQYGMSKVALMEVVWQMIFCIVFGGHWLEVLFINYIKFMLPANMTLLYLTRIVFWYLCAIPLFVLASYAGNLFTRNIINFGSWQSFGFFYIGIELFMHLIMQLRFKKSFYNGVY